MKRYIALFVAAALLALALVGCGEVTPAESTTTSSTATTASATTSQTTATETTTEVSKQTETTPGRIDFPPKPAYELTADDVKNHTKVPLWAPDSQPFEIEDEKIKNKFYKQALISAYIVDGSDSCVVVFPGGGYTTLTEAEGANVAKAYNEKGISAFVCYYRCNYYAEGTKTTAGYTRDAFLADGQRAVQFARYYGAQYGINQNKIAVCGFSAGGHLAMLVCQHPGSNYIVDAIGALPSTPNACILGYAVTDLTPGLSSQTSQHFFANEEERTNPDLITEYSYRHAPASMPATYIWYGEKDTTVNAQVCSVDCANALKDAGVDVLIESFADIGHGAALAAGTSAEVWLEHSVQFIEKVFG